MKPSVISGIVVAVLVVIGAGLFVLSGDSDDVVDTIAIRNQAELTAPVQNDATETSQLAPDSNPNDQLLKADEVAQRNTEAECWTIIDGVVYDITEYVARHPGGDKILLACGGDGSTLFNQRQTEDGEQVGSGTPHSSRAAGQLADYRIGTIDTTEE